MTQPFFVIKLVSRLDGSVRYLHYNGPESSLVQSRAIASRFGQSAAEALAKSLSSSENYNDYNFEVEQTGFNQPAIPHSFGELKGAHDKTGTK